MTLMPRPTRRHRHSVRLDASVTRSGGFVLQTMVTDLSLEGCCLSGYFQAGEIIDLRIRTIGRFPAQIQWVKFGKAGARFLARRAPATSPEAAKRLGLAGDIRGVAAIEYAFIAALIAVSLVAAFTRLGVEVGEQLGNVGAAVEHSDQRTYDSSDGGAG
jgi:Flp pilus assembly pilin Flp